MPSRQLVARMERSEIRDFFSVPRLGRRSDFASLHPGTSRYFIIAGCRFAVARTSLRIAGAAVTDPFSANAS